MRAILAVFAMLAFAGAAVAEGQRQMSVTGEGTVFAAPDMATVTLGMSLRGQDAGQVMQAVNEQTRAILATLGRFGVAPADMQTSNLSLQPIYDTRGSLPGTPEVSGYQASNMVTVRVRDLDGLGALLSGVLEDGANSLNGLSFGVSDPAPLMEEARRRAVADAMARAAVYADAAGVALGPVLSISETGGFRPQPEMMASARMSDVPVAAGEVGMSASVAMTFALSQ